MSAASRSRPTRTSRSSVRTDRSVHLQWVTEPWHTRRVYCLAPYRACADGSGWEPDLPEGWSFEEIAAPAGYTHRWAIFDVSPPRDRSFEPGELRAPGGCTELDQVQQALVRSAKANWPPALAWARHALSANEKSESMNEASFVAELTRIIEAYLKAQSRCPFFLARSRVDCWAYGGAVGAYVWIVSFDPSTQAVGWVSNDCFIYSDLRDHFDIRDDEALSRLVGWKVDDVFAL